VNVEATSDLPDQLPWEALHQAGHQFVTLDNRWPVGRMAGRVVGQDRVIQRQVDGEVRLLAVLAAVDASGRDQWLALKEVLTETQLTWSLTVLVSEKDLLDEIQGLQDGRIRAEMLRDREHLLGTIERVKPNLVHFFCHGTAGGTAADGSMAAPTLLFCTAADRIVEQSSVVIEAKDLSRHPGLQQSLWLMTLNCCDSSAARGVPSLARSLVNEKLPAVLGMRERIVPQNAHLFCRPFYRSVLRQIMAVAEHGGAPADIEWIRALWEPRRELAQLAAAQARGWTIPVMYVRPEPFQLRQPPAHLAEGERKELEARLQKLKEYRDTMGRDISPRMLAELEEEIRRIGQLLYA
jgi:hypothetical protein